MKFSKLSTIFFEDNDFQNKSPLDLPIVPRGELMTIMELAEGFDISLLTAIPSIPPTIDIVNVQTDVRTSLSNTATAPCVFAGTIPATLRPGIYRAEFSIRKTRQVVSSPFRVVAGNDWGCIVGNSPNERYSDGTPSIVGGRLVKFRQYFRRKDFRLVPVENNTFYDDERGTSFSLQNKNFSRYRLEGYAGERTAAAVSMLLSGSWSMLTYKDVDGNDANYRIRKTGDLTTEAVGRGFCQFSGDFNARRQKKIAISLDDAETAGVVFGSSENVILKKTALSQPERVPTALFCLPYTNFEVEKKDGSLFVFDTSEYYESLAMTSGKIPDNFGRSMKFLNVGEIRQSDKITEIGDNVNLKNGASSIKANFTSLHKIGVNVSIGKITGSLQFSNNPVFDNLKIPNTVPIFCKSAVFKNCKLSEYNIVGDVSHLQNVTLDPTTFNSGVVRRDAIISDSRFLYAAGTYQFDAQRIIGCRMTGGYMSATVFDMRNFSGSIIDSFAYQRLEVATDARTSTFRIDEKSMHGYVIDTGDYLASVQRIDGRRIDGNGVAAVKWTKVNNALAFDYEPVTDTLLTNDGIMATRGAITAADIGDNTPDDLLSDVTLSGTLTLVMKGDIGRSNLNNVSGSSSTVVMPATMLLFMLQSGGSFLNNVDFTLQIDSDLPDGFSYLLIKTNPQVLQNTNLTINVDNDRDSQLTARLRELYPTFTINEI